jgi:WhiB family redox-sensing transcriptional regulator
MNRGGQQRRPPVIADTPAWMDAAVCRQPGADPDLWFPADNDADGWDAAAAACDRCPVRARCLARALALGEVTHGVWGGLTPRQRRRMQRSRAAA